MSSIFVVIASSSSCPILGIAHASTCGVTPAPAPPSASRRSSRRVREAFRASGSSTDPPRPSRIRATGCRGSRLLLFSLSSSRSLSVSAHPRRSLLMADVASLVRSAQELSSTPAGLAQLQTLLDANAELIASNLPEALAALDTRALLPDAHALADPHPPRHPLLRTPAPRPPRRALRRRLLEPRARASPRVRRHRGARGPAQIRPRVR